MESTGECSTGCVGAPGKERKSSRITKGLHAESALTSPPNARLPDTKTGPNSYDPSLLVAAAPCAAKPHTMRFAAHRTATRDWSRGKHYAPSHWMSDSSSS